MVRLPGAGVHFNSTIVVSAAHEKECAMLGVCVTFYHVMVQIINKHQILRLTVVVDGVAESDAP